MRLDLQKIEKVIQEKQCAVHDRSPEVIILDRDIKVETCCLHFHLELSLIIDQLGHDQLVELQNKKNI
jgi:hypothetical protein